MLWLLLLGMNVLSFALMGLDKHRARRGKWRIPEKTLFLSAALFGALGGVLGMRIFRHKTKHRSFTLGFPALLAVQAAIVILIYVR